MQKLIKKSFFAKKAHLVAPKLLGLKLCAGATEAMITEVEAYGGSNDPASHAFKLTERSRIMHETFGHWYVYFIYGNHHCLNITCGKGEAGAVLIREAIPLKGIELMKGRRGTENENILCNGPGKLCQAFGIDKRFNGLALGEKLWLERISEKEKNIINQKMNLQNNNKNLIKHNFDWRVAPFPRIGISKAKELAWRFKLS